MPLKGISQEAGEGERKTHTNTEKKQKVFFLGQTCFCPVSGRESPGPASGGGGKNPHRKGGLPERAGEIHAKKGERGKNVVKKTGFPIHGRASLSERKVGSSQPMNRILHGNKGTQKASGPT